MASIDVTPVMKRVLDYAVNKAYGNDREIKWLELYAGSNSNDLYGSILPDETLDAMKEYRISIKGPLTTPIGSGHKSLNVMIRQKLDLFACVRPIKYFPEQALLWLNQVIRIWLCSEKIQKIYILA